MDKALQNNMKYTGWLHVTTYNACSALVSPHCSWGQATEWSWYGLQRNNAYVPYITFCLVYHVLFGSHVNLLQYESVLFWRASHQIAEAHSYSHMVQHLYAHAHFSLVATCEKSALTQKSNCKTSARFLNGRGHLRPWHLLCSSC